MAMAYPQMYAQNTAKGTLMPGQMISVNKYNLQVEKYLSQGMSSTSLALSSRTECEHIRKVALHMYIWFGLPRAKSALATMADVEERGVIRVASVETGSLEI